MVMKIENYVSPADVFNFPYNPISYDDVSNSNHEIMNLPYQKHHVLISGGGIAPKDIILTGHFSGTDKLTNFRLLSKHFTQTTKLKKLYFESDKFALGIGKQIKKTNTGGRTNFIDYVATFQSIVGILFGDTEKTTGTNEGNIKTYITKISGNVINGDEDVTLKDGTVTLTIPNSELTTDDEVIYNFVKMVDSGSGIFISEYAYVTINGIQTKSVAATGGFGILTLDVGIDISTVSTTNLSSEVIKFRDGYSG